MRYACITQIERRGIHLAAGPHAYLLSMYRVSRVMRRMEDEPTIDPETCWKKIEEGLYIDANATLETAMPIFDRSAAPFLPVVRLSGEDAKPELQGVLLHVDALKAYNRAMAAVSAEEHS